MTVLLFGAGVVLALTAIPVCVHLAQPASRWHAKPYTPPQRVGVIERRTV